MTVSIEEDHLVVYLESSEMLWALKRRLRIPLQAIHKVSEGIPGPRIVDIRAPGTFIPGVIKAGTYLTRQGKEFWYVTRGKPHYLTIDVAGGYRFKRIVLGVDDIAPLRRVLQAERSSLVALA